MDKLKIKDGKITSEKVWSEKALSKKLEMLKRHRKEQEDIISKMDAKITEIEKVLKK